MPHLAEPDIVLFLARLIVGVFFVLARFRWFYDPTRTPAWFNPERRKHLVWKLCACGYGTHPILAAGVALVEVTAGLGLIVGLLVQPAAAALFATLLFATLCTAREKVLEQNPVDKVDCVSCYLWRVEGPYLLLCLGLALVGGGYYSLDYLMFG